MKIDLPNYPNYPILEDDNILLRQVVMADIPQIIEITFFDAKPAKSAVEAIKMQDRINQDYEKGTCYNWLIVDKNKDEIVGSCGYHGGFLEKIGEVGCVMKSKYCGQGYMTKALLLAIDYGFKELKLSKIIAVTTKSNTKAMALLGRLGFEKEKDLEDESVLYSRLNI